MLKLIASSVVRGKQQDPSEGGVYLVDFEKPAASLAIDWNSKDFNWRGRGSERGLRGIAFDGQTIYLAAGDELFALTPQFRLKASWRNPYLKSCREITVHRRNLFLVSSAYDSILGFDLDKQAFNWGMQVTMKQFRFKPVIFDPNGSSGPLPLNKLQLNDIHCNANGLYLCGSNTGGLLHFSGKTIMMSAELPPRPQNAMPFRKGVLFIDNEAKMLRYSDRENSKEDRGIPLPTTAAKDLLNPDSGLGDNIEVGYGRGLCPINDRMVAVGSSPSTITVYDLQESRQLLSLQISNDKRNAIHGLELWPY